MKFRYIWKVLFPFQNKQLCTFLVFFPPVFPKESVKLNTQRGRLTSGIFLTFKHHALLNWFESQRLFSFQNLSLTYLCSIRRWMSILWIPQPLNRNMYPPSKGVTVLTPQITNSPSPWLWETWSCWARRLRSWLPSYQSKPCWVDQMPSHSHFHTLHVIWALLGSQIPEPGAQIRQRNIPTPFDILCYPVLSSKKLQMAVLLPLK